MSLREESIHAHLPSLYGKFEMYIIPENTPSGQKEHVVLVMGQPENNCLVRIHSECMTGDLFGSVRCDCGQQLRIALHAIEQEQQGILIYLRQEGRGIGLSNKLRAYTLQDQGRDTVQANIELGYEADERNYEVAVRILRSFSIDSVRLLTNNPLKIEGLESEGISVVERVPVVPDQISPLLRSYLEAKTKKMGHLIDLSSL